MRAAFFTLVFLLASPAHAALVDNESFTTDTVTGLDWLDLGYTVDMAILDAPVNNPGWRLATNSEIETLFGQLFPGFTSGSSGFCSSWAPAGCYAGQYQDAFDFISLMQGPPSPGLNCLTGTYFDEDAAARAIGGCVYNDGSLRSEVYGTEYGGNYSSYVETGGNTASNTGAMLVRSTAYVPIPATVWLFGSALAGLGWLKRKQIA